MAMSCSVTFRIIWRNVSALSGVCSANAESNVTGAGSLPWVAPCGISNLQLMGASGPRLVKQKTAALVPNSSETQRQVIIEATHLTLQTVVGHTRTLKSQIALTEVRHLKCKATLQIKGL